MTRPRPIPPSALDPVTGVKNARIYLSTTYPIVSAFEFEFLKGEALIRERLAGSTVYMIVQRPLTYFANVELGHGVLRFDIVDDVAPPLRCEVRPSDIGLCSPDDDLDVEVQFFNATPGTTQPFQDVAAIKLYRTDGTFLVWWSPQKFLFELLVNGLEAGVSGDPADFLDYRVHYIGKAFSQKVWNRLTGHEKMQRILTVEAAVGSSRAARAPFEISLIMLTVVGFDDIPEFPHIGITDRPGVPPIPHVVDLNDDDAVRRFMFEALIPFQDEAMTREAEAFLIQHFRPGHNQTLFENYPNIAGGMRSKGYGWTDLVIERLPASLRTDHYQMEKILFEAEEDAA